MRRRVREPGPVQDCQKIIEMTPPTMPTIIRIHPIVCTLIPFTCLLTANARIAPIAVKEDADAETHADSLQRAPGQRRDSHLSSRQQRDLLSPGGEVLNLQRDCSTSHILQRLHP